MSDGPHRSLPMRRAWCRVAERADKRSFSAGEVSGELAVAVERDCRVELRPSFIGEIRRIAEEPTLFREDAASRIEALRPDAGAGLERAFLDRFAFLSAREADGFASMQAALGAAMRDGAYKRARQVEEHYLREASSARASNMRGRMDEAIGVTDFAAIAGRFLDANPRKTPSAPAKQTGLDDGVSLP